jgi:hypothetical protein
MAEGARPVFWVLHIIPDINLQIDRSRLPLDVQSSDFMPPGQY